MSNTIDELSLTELVYKSLHHYRKLIIHYNEELAKDHNQYAEYEVLTYCRLLRALEFSKHTINLKIYDKKGKKVRIYDLLNLYKFMCKHRNTSPKDIDFTNHLPLLKKFISHYGYSYDSYKNDFELKLIYTKLAKQAKGGEITISRHELELIKSRLEKIEKELTLGIMNEILYNISNSELVDIAKMLGLIDYRIGCITMLEDYEE